MEIDKLSFLTGISAGSFTISLIAAFFPEQSGAYFIFAIISCGAAIYLNWMLAQESKNKKAKQ
jgi:ABC-type Fe3+-siderophore transport system permease subunit